MNVAQITKMVLVISIVFAVLMVAFVTVKGKKQMLQKRKKGKKCDLYSFGSHHRSKWCHLCI